MTRATTTPKKSKSTPKPAAGKVASAKTVAVQVSHKKSADTRPKPAPARAAKSPVNKPAPAPVPKSAASASKAKGGAPAAVAPGRAGAAPVRKARGAPPAPAGKGRTPSVKRAQGKALDASVKVFQVCDEAWQLEMVDPRFEAFDVSHLEDMPPTLDLWLRVDKEMKSSQAQMWGLVSWQFAEQAGCSGEQWLAQMQAGSGVDVYFSGGDCRAEAVFHNPWLAGQAQWPGFLELAQGWCAANDIDPAELQTIMPSAMAAEQCLFVASRPFWGAFLPWLRRTLAKADKRMPAALKEMMLQRPNVDALHGTLPSHDFSSLVVERLLPLFLRTEGRSFKAQRIALPQREQALNVHEKLLREMKDVAHRTQSNWLAACWVNYRNLYLSQTKGKAWVQTHLRGITPPQLKFA